MKKKLLILFALLVCGCEMNDNSQQEIIKYDRKKIIMEYANKIHSDISIEEQPNFNIYLLRSFITEIDNKVAFEGCNTDETGFTSSKVSSTNGYYMQYQVVIKCGDENATYYYNSLSDTEPFLTL